MKSVGILTFQWFDNYGTVLQAYALQTALQSLNCRAGIVPLNIPSESITHRVLAKSLHGAIEKWNKLFAEGWNCRRNGFAEFRKNYFNYLGLPSLTFGAVSSAVRQLDAVVLGSDNIWSVGCYPWESDMAAVFLGDGIRHHNKYVYAASTGGKIVNRFDCKKILERIRDAGFKRISLRESANIEVFNKNGLNAELVPDPSMLLSASDWSARASSEKTPTRPYVFGYDLGHSGVCSVREGCEIAAKKFNNCRIVIPFSRNWFADRKINIRPTPQEWLSLIENAECVITNSFHGVMFSIIFHKKFVFLKIKGTQERMELNMRALEILDNMGLNDCIADEGHSVEAAMSVEIDWEKVQRRLTAFRTHGLDYLLKMVEEI